MTTEIVEYSKTEAALADLGQRYKGVVFDVTTREGMQAAIKGRAEIRKYRTSLEDLRKAIKAPALRRCQVIDEEARRITKELLALEEPIDEQIKKEEQRKLDEKMAAQRAEEARLKAEEEARKKAEEERLAAERAAIDAERAKLEAEKRERDEQERQARLKLEAEEREARLRIEEQERISRLAREEADRKAREAREAEEARQRAALKAEEDRLRSEREAAERERRAAEDAARRLREEQEAKDRAARAEQEAKERAEREAREAEERERQRKAAELLDARGMLMMFKERYGKLDEFAAVIKAINAYFNGIKS